MEEGQSRRTMAKSIAELTELAWTRRMRTVEALLRSSKRTLASVCRRAMRETTTTAKERKAREWMSCSRMLSSRKGGQRALDGLERMGSLRS